MARRASALALVVWCLVAGATPGLASTDGLDWGGMSWGGGAPAPAPAPASPAGDLSLIAPGLTASNLCQVVRGSPETAIAAIANGATQAYDQGTASAFSAAVGAAAAAGNAGGCIDEVFEAVNQALMRGGWKVEKVIGMALAAGSAKGVASDEGKVLAQATATVICNGGASADACARAWYEAVQIDKNGCAVLAQAYAQARAKCSEGKVQTSATASVFKKPLGVCGLTPSGGGGGGGGGSGAAGPSVSQGAFGQVIHYGDGTVVSQGLGGQTIQHTWAWGRRRLQGVEGAGSRKLLQVVANSAAVATNSGYNSGLIQANSASSATGSGYGGPVVSNSNAIAKNEGYNAGGIIANSQSSATHWGNSGGWGGWGNGGGWGGGWGRRRLQSVVGAKGGRQLLQVVANSAAVATNSGYNSGLIQANSASSATGSGYGGPVVSNSNAIAKNEGYNAGGIIANSQSSATHWGNSGGWGGWGNGGGWGSGWGR